MDVVETEAGEIPASLEVLRAHPCLIIPQKYALGQTPSADQSQLAKGVLRGPAAASTPD